jgi:hypothetical protein
MQFPADAMSDEINGDGEVCLRCDRLKLARDGTPTPTGRGGSNRVLKHRFRALDERTTLGRNIADTDRDRAIRAPTVETNADVNGDEVTILHDARARNPVHQFLIDTDAGRGWKRWTRLRGASVANEERLATTRENRTVCSLINLRGSHSSLARKSSGFEDRCNESAGAFNSQYI